MGKVNQEMAEHGDMVMLPVSYSCHSRGEAEGWLLALGSEVEERLLLPPFLFEGEVGGIYRESYEVEEDGSSWSMG